MSIKHLQTGDAKPTYDTTKKFRLYSMGFCPYAQRPRLVAAAKGLKDYDIVNIKLRAELPEWYPAINPLRAVPAIEFPDGQVIYESLIVCDLLEELYPEKPLHSKDPKEKAKQSLFVDRYGNTFVPSFYKHFKNVERTDDTKLELEKHITTAEQYLVENKSKFFAGEQVGMIDFMIWPWFERLPSIYSLSADKYPKLVNWFNLMQNEPAVKATSHSKETYAAFYGGYFKGKVDYDMGQSL